MSDTYKGESWPKKLARLNFWSRAALLPSFFRQPILCLASREAGDISVLKAFGVEPKNIVAVDICKEAAEAAQALHPDVVVRHADAGDVQPPLPYAAALLDFCCPVSAEIAKVVAKVSCRMAQRGLLGVAVLSGRERGLARDFLDQDFAHAYAAEKDERFARSLAKRGEPVAILSSAGKWDRDATISSLVEEFDRTVFLFGVGSIRYQSVTADSRGVPMVITPFIVNKLNRFNLTRSRLRAIERMNAISRAALIAEVSSAIQRGEELSDEPPVDPLETIIPSDIDACKREALRILGLGGVDTAAALNLSRGQAAALRAHGTMGTYAVGSR